MNLNILNKHMKEIRNWSLEGSSIVKEQSFANFKEALEFVNKVGEIAEKHRHHPDFVISYNVVKLSLTTHSVHDLTEKDFDVARDIDNLSK
ncbi:4a-hydroxytetrahydrobiopterin dehydratase [Candidatus Pacearchaeota archaeon]|nr:4a-hydroxytetrahydrobiopterin dehydratase [Candidatus Pacearchaeota archaeon]